MSSLLILFGSETGTAQDTAESLRREAILQGLAVRLMAMDEYEIDNLPDERVVVLVVATTGQGELPPNMRTSWRRLLRKSLPTDWLSKVNFAVLGLGDSSYQKYNFAGKKLYRRLLQLGATQLVELGLADDQHELGVDGAFVPWKKSLWEVLHEANIFENMSSNFDPSSAIPPKYVLDFSCALPSTVSDDQEYFELPVLANERVTADDHFQDTRLVDLAIPESSAEKFKYQPGDVLMVRPCNLPETIEIAIEAMGYTSEVLDKPFTLRANDRYVKTPPTWLIGTVTTLRKCLSRLFDLQMIPRKSFFEVLGSLSSDEMEKEKLLELASPQGLDDLLDYSIRCRRTVAETLRDFPRTAQSIPPERLFDLFCPIRARAFSIASSPDAHPEKIQILVAKVEYKSRMSVPRRGLCSSFIAGLRAGDKVFCRVRAGTFRFPDHSVPVICVGPGTGVAPFRSYLSSRHVHPQPSSSLLYFGCRGREKDFYFSEEWTKITTTTVHTAFSRETEERVYVQHVMKQTSEQIWQHLHVNEGMLFVAGSAGDMPRAVVAELEQIAASKGWDGKYVPYMEARSRIQYETWS